MISPAVVLLALAAPPAGGLAAYPADVTLAGRDARQQLVAVTTDGPAASGDVTDAATYVSSDPKVAAVEGGVVRAVGDGDAAVTVTHAGQTAKVAVRVRGAAAPPPVTFRNHVQAVMTRAACNSGACHGALAGKGGLKLSLRGYDPDADHFALTRQAAARRVDREHPDRSLLLLKPVRALPHGGGQKFDDESDEYRTIRDWVAAGAKGPSAADSTLARVEAFPPAARLAPGGGLRVVVRAWYSDGRAEDVTARAKFVSSEEQVASVDEDGKVTAAGHGEAAVSVLFGTFVASVPVAVPFANDVPADTFARQPRNNVIDELVLKKLASLRLPPSPLCSDREFIRRAFLDAAGILPTAEEVEKFAADPAADKRAKLVDAILARPEFTDYWAYKWSDLLLVSTRKLPQPAMWAFYRAVRQAVADDVPWDKFARELLTASGSTLDRGTGNYFALHTDPAELTEATAVTFLGTSITCARCHNHPLEKWTQDQYWGMANLFSRVGIKNGERTGEKVVWSLPEGDVLHPRKGVPQPPAPLDAKPLPPGSDADRRKVFADWLTAADNPFFARAAVNRVWRNFFGRGLVEAEDDLRATNPPSNAELFDALAADFVKHGYGVKRLVRLVMTSATYQRSSVPLPGNAGDDRFGSHYLPKRLSAEVILDAYAQVTGVPTAFTHVYTGVEGGTAATPNYPMGTRAMQLPDTRVASQFLDGFGRPDRMQTCSCERQQDSSVGQALHLNNGKTLNDKLRDPKGVLAAWLAGTVPDDEVVRRVFVRGLAREPAPAEAAKFQAALAAAGPGGRREALEDVFWAVLTSREFLFNR